MELESIEYSFLPDFSLWTFLKSLDWEDPWIIGLVSFHILITLTTVTTRYNSNFQIVLFVVLLLLVYFSENLNEFAKLNWQSFARHEYFDEKGMFISIVFSIPLLLNCMMMVAIWLYQSSEVLVQLKKAQLKQLKKEKDK
uniref:Transmembrane protein 18 n=1 Tax=Cacopsylla melanoneura TaxID=428564 RepID=A0A8D9BCK8_9HEMI